METQLIIRAPNQNIEDQVIQCNMDWTVLKLKIHLSQVYPSRPVVQEQKLIYSGHLLHDHMLLKDVIKQDVSNTQTLHLVCYKKYTPSSEQNPESSQNQPKLSTPNPMAELNSDSSGTSENTLRHRHGSVNSQINTFQPQFSQPITSTMPLFPNDPQMLAQMAAMQQMYAQYLTHYWQSINMSSPPGNVHPVLSDSQSQQNNTVDATQEAVAEQPVIQRNNVLAMLGIENNNGERDWWDYVFLYLKFLFLLGIMYYYSSPERFMVVVLTVVIAFLYHEGWFVRHGFGEVVMIPRPRNRLQVDPNPNAGNNAEERQQVTENEVNDGHELEAAMDGEDPPHAQNADATNNNNNNQVFSPLTFVTSFFSSLIPEPPPPVNIN